MIPGRWTLALNRGKDELTSECQSQLLVAIEGDIGWAGRKEQSGCGLAILDPSFSHGDPLYCIVRYLGHSEYARTA